MIDVANLKPSDIETLLEEGVSPETKKAILVGVNRMLKEIRPDQGADSDRIHLSANMLAMAKVWEVVSPAELARALDGVQKENVTDFLQGLPAVYGREVAYEMVTSRDEAEPTALIYTPIQNPVTVSIGFLELLKQWRARRNSRWDGSVITHVAVRAHTSAEKDVAADKDEVVIEGSYYLPKGRSSKTGRFTSPSGKKRGVAVRRRADT